jgi:hypothetical protein
MSLSVTRTHGTCYIERYNELKIKIRTCVNGQQLYNVVKQRKVSKVENTIEKLLIEVENPDSSLAGRYDHPICCTGPPGYIGWWNRYLRIDSRTP